jgi:hypothetical protein
MELVVTDSDPSAMRKAEIFLLWFIALTEKQLRAEGMTDDLQRRKICTDLAWSLSTLFESAWFEIDGRKLFPLAVLRTADNPLQRTPECCRCHRGSFVADRTARASARSRRPVL